MCIRDRLESLKAKGHNISEEPLVAISVVQAIASSCDRDQRPDCIEAVCDWRKYGAPDGITTANELMKCNEHNDVDDNYSDYNDASQTTNSSADYSLVMVHIAGHTEL